ncbi:Major facilitator superfamily domain containing 5 [Nesidiocoris tenuis]|uniref:Molybdate-anion transporter n=2 Tax=Nesidiocoris tenuis TaxID=355587 RepID=A0ABN7B0P0_9HEMI|nr:Major facilitator superfamily domain containing 5 [Nesidiocoris tenuis]
MFPRIVNHAVKKWKTLKRHVEKALVSNPTVMDKKSHSLTEPHNIHYKNLQRCYLIAFSLATFADWLQGPYLYKLYKDYGHTDDTIARLYITGFVSSCIFGTLVGHLADRFGRKMLCSSFTVMYALSCMTKTSPSYSVLSFGRILGGISTSILFTTFEAWYVNEHINFLKLPAEWLNSTFSKATFYNGLSAISAGILAQIFAEYFELGPVFPFIIAIPFLFMSLLVIQSTWKEHAGLVQPRDGLFKDIFSPLKLLFENDRSLLFLGLVQTVFESVMYTFVFSWTPILADLQPPLGIVFSLFMISVIVGSKTYSCLIAKRYQPQNLLTASCAVSALTLTVVTLSLTSMVVHIQDHDPITNKSMSVICLAMFLVYEVSVGIYYPAIGYLRSRSVPEEYRATLSNWLRVPMNVFTCLMITLNNGSDSEDVTGLKKFQFIFGLSTFMMIGAVVASTIFARKYSKKVVCEEVAELKAGKRLLSETV